MDELNELYQKVLLVVVGVLLSCALAGCTKKKDLSAPPLNPHPKEAVHIHVSFDNPDDAKLYRLSMDGLYQNQQEECGYIASWWVGNFVYPSGQFDIPNESSDPKYGDFTIYLDRYNRETCNWEFSSFGIEVTHISTRWAASTAFGRESIAPGNEFKTVCTFVSADPNMCWDQPRPDPPKLFHKVPLTLRVSQDSALLHPRLPGFFDHFLEPMHPADASSTNSQN
ncbi:hypothetical protein ACFONN_05685 [Dyella humi]|uniref:Lipoprotein n=1 Tax=Dyella humi TaxID=1770547 RepID=A0ABW8IHC9_9GAMM